jgi:3-hydroxyisobutyrate dehydrogenase/2-hydroxy-3-oxopropionate reductase
MARVGVIGLGAMGSRIARRFVDAGHELVVWSRDPEKDVDGAKRADSAQAAARDTEAVIVMVSDGDALAAVTDALRGASTVIQMSTVGVRATAQLADALADGVELLDAPVLGSISEVEAGTLTVFAGSDAAAVERWTPLLSTLGKVLHVGPVGAGSAAKLVANSTLFGVVSVLGEAIALADRLGLPREKTFDVLAATPVAAQAERRRGVIETGESPVRFALALALKDAELIRQAAPDADLRLADAARSWIADAEAAGLGDEDYALVLKQILD